MSNIYKSDKKRAFLTFDDGPSSVTPQILDCLKQENIKATFFVLGTQVEAMPETTKRIYEEGHFVANHGYSHIYTSIYQSPQSVLDEFNRCNDAVKNAIGVPEYNSHLFRFPGGITGGRYAEIKSQANELLKQNDIMYVDWNALTGDAETNNLSIEFELMRLQQTVLDKNSVIILMHDAQAKKVTAEALPQIISYLKEQGYELKSFYDIIR
ncbi:MAG: polysaccharide deacetylase [Clostridia bacterium]|nr:polysaccharide deacetylase [Clostridia bacterium]